MQAIKYMRQIRELSQGELASKAKISRSYLSEIESGKKSPSLEVLTEIANQLGLDAWQLLYVERFSETLLGAFRCLQETEDI